MTARKKSEKRITLPKAPVCRAEEVRAHIARVGIDEQDVLAAVSWARESE